MPIYVTRPSMPDFNDYIEAIRPIFESHILTNMGPVYQELRRRMTEYLGVPHLSLFVNGHMALELAIQALGWQNQNTHPGIGEVITTPFTFVSTVHAISRNRLKPVFCDIRPGDHTLDPAKIEPLITENTVGILPVHVYGNVCDVEEIGTVAEKYHLPVIYDAAHAFGITYKGVGIGNYGDASMFSFHATKVFNSIEGGAVAFRDGKYQTALHELKNFGLHGEEGAQAIGPNAKMNEFAAAMGLCNLRRIEECIRKRKAVYQCYRERLHKVPGITLWEPQPDVSPNYAYLPVLFDKKMFGKSRDEVWDALREKEIYARKYFYPAVNEMPCYKGTADEYPTPVAHDVSARVLTLPMYEDLTPEEVNQICDVILSGRRG